MAKGKNIEGQGFHTDPDRINRSGRPKGALNRSTLVRRWMEAQGSKPDMAVVDDLILAQIQKAQGGDTYAFKELMDSGYGKTPDKLEQSGPDGKAIPHSIEVTFVDPKG
jgi:hypothetical protein